MNNRQNSIISLLMQNNDYTPISAYAGKLGISSKTFRRELPAIEKELASFGAQIDKRPGVGIRLNLELADNEELINSVTETRHANTNYSDTVLGRHARAIDLAFNLLCYSDEVVSISSLAYKYYVSKSSIYNTLILLDSYFSNHKLELVRSKKGTYISGKESDIREALADLVIYLSDSKIDTKSKGELRSTSDLLFCTKNALLDIFSEVDLVFVEAQLQEMSFNERYAFDDLEFFYVSIRQLVALSRVKSGFFLESDYRVVKNDDTLSKFSVEIANSIKRHYCITFPETEVSYLHNLLTATNLNINTSETAASCESSIAIAFSEDFLDAFSVVTGTNLKKNQSLHSSVISHIIQMLHRAKLNMPAHNPIVEELCREYGALVNVCRIICWTLTGKFALSPIDIDEICYLMLYIQGEIIANEKAANILLVSNSHESVNIFFEKKLLQRYPQWKITVCNYNDYLTRDKSAFHLIISTVLMSTGNAYPPHILVSSLLEPSDFQNIDSILMFSRNNTDQLLFELQRAANDLNDIGCSVTLVSASERITVGENALSITASEDISIIFHHNTIGRNDYIFIVDYDAMQIRKIIVDMCEWDFMLFSSKLVYLLCTYPEKSVKKFIKSIIEGNNAYV